MESVIRPFRALLPDEWKEDRRVTIVGTMVWDIFLIAGTDTAGKYEFKLPLRMESGGEDEKGPYGVVLTPQCYEFKQFWEVRVEQDYDEPVPPSDHAYFYGTTIYVQSYEVHDRLNFEDLVRDKLDIPRPEPLEGHVHVIQPFSGGISVEFQPDGTYRRAAYSTTMRDPPFGTEPSTN